jgi:hypothetical protein
MISSDRVVEAPAEAASAPAGASGGPTVGPDEVIHLDRTDDIDTLLDRLESVSGRCVVVVVPGSSDMLASLVSLRLLKRRAEALQLEVFLVARDSQTRMLAREAGVRVFTFKFEALLELRWRQWREHPTLRPGVLTEKRKRPKVRRRPQPGDQFRLRTARSRGRFLSILMGLLILAAVIAGLAYTVFMLLPAANVTVVPAIRRVSETTLVTADLAATEIDPDTKTVPARLIEVRLEGTASVSTASKKPAPNNPAKGVIIFSNRTAQEVKVPAGTVVRTSTGTNIRFQTLKEVTVPAGQGSRASAEIVALQPGPSGNVGPYLITTIEGALALSLAAANDQPTAGGDMKQVGVVTQVDRDRAKSVLQQQLRQQAYLRIQEQIDEQEFVPPETVQMVTLSELYDKFLDEAADELSLKMTVVATGVAVAGQDANKVALDALQASVPQDYVLVAPGLTFERGEIRLGEKRRLSFPMTASGIAVAKIDTSGLREALVGQPVPRAQAIVMERLPLKREPAIEVRPDWFGRMPQVPFRINVIVVTELD